VNVKPMNAKDDDLRPEYPKELIESGERGKYAKRDREEDARLVLIDSDLHDEFPNSDSVNRALREYLEFRRKAVP